MTTATAQRPPTEQEITEAIDKAIHELQDVQLGDAPLCIAAGMESWLWHVDDLRPSERERLDLLSEPAAARIRERFRAIVIEELTPVAIQFAMEHPEAPRAD
jgi:hypothetical protein